MTDARRGRIAALAVAVLLLAPAAADAKPLKRGSDGARVAKVQSWLGIASDGIFGPGTNLADAADEVLRLLGHNNPPVDEAAE